MIHRNKWLLVAFVMVLAGNQIAPANPPVNPSKTVTLSCLKLPPLWHGVLCLIAGRYEQTIAICDEVLRANPNHQAAYAVRGYAHLFKRSEDRQAIADLTEALRRGPDNAVLHVARAQAYEPAKDYDSAIADCTQAIRIDPSHGRAYAWRAGCYLEKRITNKALADYTLALRHAPYLAWARCGRAECCRRRGEPARALADLEEVLRGDPENELARSNRCIAYLNNLHDFDRVIAESSEFIRLFPRDPKWYMMRSMAYLAKGEGGKGSRDWASAVALKPGHLRLRCYHKPHSIIVGFGFGPSDRPPPWEDTPEERIAACTKRLASDPNNVAAYWERAYAYERKREYKRAIADLDEIIRRDPADTYAYLERSLSYFDLNSYTQALADCTKAIQLDPENADYYYARARVYRAQGKNDEALSDANHALQLEPRMAMAYAFLGWMYDSLGEYNRAIVEYSQALRLSPEDAQTYACRGWARGNQGDYEGSIADYKETLRIDPQNVPVHRSLAWYLATSPDSRLRNGKEAQHHASLACKATSWRDPTYLRTLAAACAECGDFDEAVKWQTKALELAPETNKSWYQQLLELYRSHQPYHLTSKR
jgi:tetratricopeptide (TPR) repeat protein